MPKLTALRCIKPWILKKLAIDELIDALTGEKHFYEAKTAVDTCIWPVAVRTNRRVHESAVRAAQGRNSPTERVPDSGDPVRGWGALQSMQRPKWKD